MLAARVLVQLKRQGLRDMAKKVDEERVNGYPLLLRAESLLERVDRPCEELPELRQYVYFLDRQRVVECGLAAAVDEQKDARLHPFVARR